MCPPNEAAPLEIGEIPADRLRRHVEKFGELANVDATVGPCLLEDRLVAFWRVHGTPTSSAGERGNPSLGNASGPQIRYVVTNKCLLR